MHPTEFDGHKVALAALVGSHNYNLDTPSSDKDYKYFVWPTFDDLYDNKKYHKEVVTETEDYTVHDVRALPDLFWKANLNFLEILYSKELAGDEELIQTLMSYRTELVTNNIPRMYNACRGTSMTKQMLMYKDSPARHESILRYGFDTKSAHHALRVLIFLERFAVYYDFQKAIFYEDDDQQRQVLLDVKAGGRQIDDVQLIIQEHEAKTEQLREAYEQIKADRSCYDAFDDAIKLMVRKRFVGGNIVGTE